jgi:hypothetical protein
MVKCLSRGPYANAHAQGSQVRQIRKEENSIRLHVTPTQPQPAHRPTKGPKRGAAEARRPGPIGRRLPNSAALVRYVRRIVPRRDSSGTLVDRVPRGSVATGSHILPQSCAA